MVSTEAAFGGWLALTCVLLGQELVGWVRTPWPFLMAFLVLPSGTTGCSLAATYRLNQLPRDLAQAGTAMLPCGPVTRPPHPQSLVLADWGASAPSWMALLWSSCRFSTQWFACYQTQPRGQAGSVLTLRTCCPHALSRLVLAASLRQYLYYSCSPAVLARSEGSAIWSISGCPTAGSM